MRLRLGSTRGLSDTLDMKKFIELVTEMDCVHLSMLQNHCIGGGKTMPLQDEGNSFGFNCY